MNMEHDTIMEEKLEQLSDQMEAFIIDVFLAVLIRLKKRSDIIFDSVEEENNPF